MGLLDALRRPPSVRVHVLLKGFIGEAWYDVDEVLKLSEGATLKDLIETAERQGVHLRKAIDASPHLKHTLMINGERCPVDENLRRAMRDGDEVYLLAPLVGG